MSRFIAAIMLACLMLVGCASTEYAKVSEPAGPWMPANFQARGR